MWVYTLNMFSGYIQEIIAYQDPNMILGETERNFLNLFQDGPRSAYSIYSYFKERNQKKAYKNVHKTVSRLVALGLTRMLTKQEETASNRLNIFRAKYYRITDKGLFYLILYKSSGLSPSLLILFKDNIVLRNLLFQYFEKETIRRLTPRLYFAIVLYLVECCTLSFTETALIKLEQDKQEKNKRIDNLKSDLEWKARLLAIELVMKSDNLNRHRIRDYSNNTISYLKNDKKFLNLLETVRKEYEDGFKSFLNYTV